MATPKARIVRVHDRTWDAAKARADSENTSLAARINEFLETYGGTESERRGVRAPAPVDA